MAAEANRPDAIRIALVMNGGVSLAVWMGGVTHEIDRLRRSGPGVAAASPAWQALCAARGQSVVVDTVAGTSAGGLNGTLLATAIARGVALPPLLALWREEARLTRRRLLHATTPEPANSVLDGDYLERTVQQRLGEITPGGDPQDVTLLVTASALHGSSTAVVDASGQSFTAGDHRRVYRFRRRAGARRVDLGVLQDAHLDDFQGHTDELAIAARASAGFPFAFGPSRETEELHALDVSGSTGAPSWLVDGGVLDNAPFRPLLDELREQPVADPAARWIVYVVPTKQTAPLGVTPGVASTPPPWTTLPGRIWSLSRESDLRDDVTALGGAWRAGRAKAHPPEELIGNQGTALPEADLITSAAALFPAYRHTKLTALVGDVVDNGSPPLRDEHGGNGLVRALSTMDLCMIPTSQTAPARPMGEDNIASWQWGIGAARRIARWISRDARGSTPAGHPVYFLHRETIAGREENLLALDDAMPTIRDRKVRERAAVIGPVQALHEATVASGLLPLVWEEMRCLVLTWAAARGLEPDEAWTRVLSAEIVTNALSWDQKGQPPGFAFHLLSPDSPHEGTMLRLGNPVDVECFPHWPDNKLYGTRFGHFGAFGARQFRDWDWMWGRIDCALTLGRALLEDSDEPVAQRAQLLDGLLKEILHECEIDGAELPAATSQVCRMTPGQLVAIARDRGEADFDGVIDDIGAMLANNSVLSRAARGGPVSKAKAWMRGWAVRRTIRFGAGRLKRLVAQQEK